jgi:nucleotide-binding universal stress UspA family protein
MDTIVVGIDGSKSAQAAARWAAREAGPSGARVVAVYAVARSELWSLSAVQVDIDDVLAEFRELLEGKWTAPLRQAGVPYTTQLVRGEPATELLRVANRARASMLVLGSHGHRPFADLIVGGTAHKVVNRATVPVVLVPAPPAAQRAARAKKR